jgi:hypothetical protein
MIGHPTAAELTQAVRRFLDEHAAPKLEGRDGFLAKVAANALAAVERELHQAPAAEAAARQRLAALLGHDGSFEVLNEELCERLASGEFDLTTPGVFDHLRATTIDQVRIDQPGYSGLAHLTGNG